MLADVGEAELGLGVALGPHLVEQRRLLGTGDDQRPVLENCALEFTELGAAELGPHARRVVAEGLGEGGAVERHGALAIADQQSLAVVFHNSA